ncbi:MAG: thioether cross-link-forming SCIFF peptide maturase [Dethiobacteria bacterium]
MFKYRGLQLVYDVNSGSLHQVDRLGWQVIELLLKGKKKEEISILLSPQFSSEEIATVLKEVGALQEEKLLFAPMPLLKEKKQRPYHVKALCLYISHNCNLQCRYCFTRDSRAGKVSNMTWEVAKKAIDLLLHEEGRFRDVDFFGGEPLLNFQLIKDIVAYARERSPVMGKEFNFTLTTNAVLLDDAIIDYLNRENICVILSLDGRPEVHDRMRLKKNGKGSYQDVIKNIRRFLQSRGQENYYVRGTYTAHNRDFSNDIRHFLQEGFYSFSLEPVVAAGDNFALQESDLPLLEEQYDQLVDIYLEYKEKGIPFYFYHFGLDLEKGPCLYKRLNGCGAGSGYLAVAADGGLYPCHQFVNNRDFYMGNLLQEPFSLQQGAGDKVAASAGEREGCSSCWARYLCGQGCAASSYFMAGDLRKTYDIGCALQKMRLERALYLQAI